MANISLCLFKAAVLTKDYKYNFLFHLVFSRIKECRLIVLFPQHKLLKLFQLEIEK